MTASKHNYWGFGLIALFTLSMIAYIETAAVESFDLWWHLKSAQVILTEGFPTTDIFSATTPNTHWFPYEWLAEIIFYLIYLGGGINGLILFKTLIAAATWGIVLVFLEKRGTSRPLNFFTVACGFALTLASWPLRPLIFSFFFFALFNAVLTYNRKYHYWLPLLTLFWANIHPSFYLGILSLTLFYGGELINQAWFDKNALGGETAKRYLLLLAGCLLASLIHPRPQEILLYPFTLITSKSFMGGISEWRPAPFISEPLFYLLVLPAGILALSRTKKIGAEKLLPILVFGAYAFTARRHIPLFALVAAINLPAAWDEPFAKTPGSASKQFLAYLPGALLLFLALLAYWPKSGKLGVKPGFFPEKAVQFIKDKQLRGPMYNAYDWGGYLIWRLYPEIKTFIDGRNSSEKLFQIDRKLREAAPDYQQILESYQINFILTSSTYFDSGRLFPLIEVLYADPQWQLVYQDETALLFLKDHPDNQKIIRSQGKDKKNIFRQVIAESQRRLELNQRLPQAYLTLGKAYLQQEDFARAEKNLKEALRLRPDFRGAGQLLTLTKELASRPRQASPD